MAGLEERLPPPPSPPKAAAAPRAVDTERDILDDQLDLLGGSVLGAKDLDGTAVELAERLVAKGDMQSALRAHRVLQQSSARVKRSW